MSEYQSYEFRAIDRPLHKKAQAALRAISSRAEITATSLTNVYHFGDFKGNTRKLMEETFDAFLYFANWGTHRLMFRLPRGSMDAQQLKAYHVEHAAEISIGDRHIILDFTSAEEECDDTWREWGLGDMISLRADLMAGDLRCLYLGWLAAAYYDSVDDDALEPPVPPGLRSLSGPLVEFAEFLYPDDGLIALAAETSAPERAPPKVSELAAWITDRPKAEKDDWLLRLIQGQESGPAGEILALYRRERKQGETDGPAFARRTAGQLREAYEQRKESQEREAAARTAREREEAEQKKLAAHTRYLQSLAGKEDQLWQKIEQLVTLKQPRPYDEAVVLLKDLRELSQRGMGAAFSAPFQRLLARHSAKSAFQRKVKLAGLMA